MKTRFKELYITRIDNGWRFKDTSTDMAVGPYYKSKAEILSDLERYGREYTGADIGIKKNETESSEHTPGPWVISSDGRTIRTPGEGSYRTIATIEGPLHGGASRANARLIATAPEMLDALKETLDALYNETVGSTDTPWIRGVKDRAQALIAKAEGKGE